MNPETINLSAKDTALFKAVFKRMLSDVSSTIYRLHQLTSELNCHNNKVRLTVVRDYLDDNNKVILPLMSCHVIETDTIIYRDRRFGIFYIDLFASDIKLDILDSDGYIRIINGINYINVPFYCLVDISIEGIFEDLDIRNIISSGPIDNVIFLKFINQCEIYVSTMQKSVIEGSGRDLN